MYYNIISVDLFNGLDWDFTCENSDIPYRKSSLQEYYFARFSYPNYQFYPSIPKLTCPRVLLYPLCFVCISGLPISAQEAYDSGLVTKVTTADQLDEEVNKIVESIKHKSRSVIALGKQFYYKQIDLSLLEAYDLGEKIMVENINMNDGQEGIKSFVEKRKANWNHK